MMVYSIVETVWLSVPTVSPIYCSVLSLWAPWAESNVTFLKIVVRLRSCVVCHFILCTVTSGLILGSVDQLSVSTMAFCSL